MSLLGELTYALIGGANRSIGFLVPDVVIEEQHHDELVVTEFPVENGAAITDHAYMRPAVLLMRCGFSNSSAGSEGYVREIYDAFLALQRSRRPFSVTTGKRLYRNMLINALDIITDQHSENTLMVTIGLREIRLTSTQAGSATDSSTAKPASAAADQSNPESTGSVVDLGSKQVQPYSAGTDSFAGVFTTQGNTTFSNTDGSLGLDASGATAGFDTITFDGQTYITNDPDVSSGLAPFGLTARPGGINFGAYGPGVFQPSTSVPF
ncbi:phage baseplate protein [Methylobacterium sp. J-068]|uniref:phage baseplate protein n=1 Tax=Methylobacterium sp. J-068 TaxID=2836649 RepID=UPI001FBBE9EF|nr:hypothetical protein [Methylobacterium sp. J-068]MCJ2036398.1 hypothetical protein [Methylobacterium sp. J-068]